MNYNGTYGGSWWWLRTGSKDALMMQTVTAKGEVNAEGERVNITSGGVRPAMWVEVK